MKSKHSDKQDYLLITPPEYKEAKVVKEDTVTVAEESDVHDDDDDGVEELKIGNQGKIQSNFLYNID